MLHCVPLHVHSHFSLLEGVDAPDALLARAAICGYSALALTDSNNLYGAVAFMEAGRHHGVRPIFGACLRHGSQRCTVLIADAVGYASLCRVLSRLHLQAPPSLFELLAANAEGLHALVDDPAEPLLEAFGPRLWLEVVRPPRSANRERALLEWGLRHEIPPVASTAAHFATADGHETFRLLTAVRRRMLLDALPARLPITPAHHLADAEQMHQRFRDLPEALVNSGLLAGQCRSDVLPRGVVLPPVPAGIEPNTYLRGLCEDALRRRVWEDELAAQQRLQQELTIIHRRGLAGYFLVVREIAAEARRRGYPIALRGSAGNSLVCYLLRITDVDPLRFDLPMERFLHAGRSDLPDIDLDFDWKIRDDIIAWVFERYGPEHAAMVSSHLTLQPRSALREAGKVHGLSNEQISRLETVETVDNLPGERVPPRFPLEPERWPRIVAAARTLLGRPHHLSIHPGGVVLTPRPLENYVPLQRAAKGTIITQFEKDAIEAIGLVKIDLLGNRGLSTLAECRQLVRGMSSGSTQRQASDRASLACAACSVLCKGYGGPRRLGPPYGGGS